jgi:uncharacterized membrane protein
MESLAVLLVIVVLGILIGPYIVAGIAMSRAGDAERAAAKAQARLKDLQAVSLAQAEQIAALRREIQAARGITPAEDAAFDAVETADMVSPEMVSPEEEEPSVPFETVEEAMAAAPAHIEELPAESNPPAAIAARESWIDRMKSGGLERQFGAVLPVWIGGVALAFAGFFLVKYSIENQLIGPEMRVILGALLGAGLIVAAHWVGGRSTVESAGRIAQSLAGAGIAVLYVVSYAATSLYGLLPSPVGFVAMAAVTGVAVVLSLRHGPPIALLGLLGGFLTPALIHSDNPSTMMLFAYL